MSAPRIVIRAASHIAAISFLPIALSSAPTGAQQPGTAKEPASSIAQSPEVDAKLTKLQEDLKAAQAEGNDHGLAMVLNELGEFYRSISQCEKALDFYKQAQAKANTANDIPKEIVALEGSAVCHVGLGKNDEALTEYQRALEMTATSGDKREHASLLVDIGEIEAKTGKIPKAQASLNAALQEFHDLHDLRGQAETRLMLGAVFLRSGELPSALDVLEQAATDSHSAGDRTDESVAYLRVGIVYGRLSQPDKALSAYEKALDGFRASGDRHNEAAALNAIGLIYSGRAEYPKALEYFNESLRIHQEMKAPIDAALALTNIGIAYKRTGQLDKAMETYNQALLAFREGSDRSDEAATLMRIGNVYQVMGEPQKAIDYLGQALVIQRSVGERLDQARTLNNLGIVYDNLGEFDKELDSLTQARQIYHEVGNRGGEAMALINMGRLFETIGQVPKALDAYMTALPVYRELGDRDNEANALNNIGMAYSDAGETEKALTAYNQALELYRAAEDRDGQASLLNNVGELYRRQHELQKALASFSQALSIVRAVGDRSGEAYALTNTGAVYSELGDKQRAVELFTEGFSIATETGDPILKSLVCYNLMDAQSESSPALAIYFGKQAVNFLQQVRSNMQNLDSSMNKSFLASKEKYYQDLARLLIDKGRLPEAQQVLDMLKQQEYTDYVRGDSADTTGKISLTAAEKQGEQDYEDSTADLVSVSEQWSQLRSITSRTPEQEQQYQKASAALAKGNQALNDYWTRLYKLFGQSSEANAQVAEVKGKAALLRDQVAQMPNTVALYTLVTSDRYSVLLITGKAMVARQYPISEKELNEKVAAFQTQLRNPSSDPHPLGQELYRILIGPIKGDLEQARAQTLVWSLGGVLRYIPMAALYDGNKYLVEKYDLVATTPASASYLGDHPKSENINALAMGISRQYEDDLKPLPAVVGELENVVKDPETPGAQGVLPGKILLNNQFTEQAMEKALEGQHPIVHIASHFVYRPGDDRASYLLLAGKDANSAGYHLTVADLRDNPNLTLTGTDLLTLSACETGVGGIAGDGREVDGLATTAQLKGAKAVISSLWQVNDTSTGLLLADFYRRWALSNGKISKAEALRQSQVDMLHQRSPSHAEADPRGISVLDAQKTYGDFEHPYYWAPFILTGNWQ